jgi:hypothetical protein
MPKTGLPTDLVRDYWRKVRDFLVEKHGAPQAVAIRGVKRFRRRVVRAGDTIYNTDPEQVAESILEWTQSATTLIPTPVEISQMPRWAALAFAGRCARGEMHRSELSSYFREESSGRNSSRCSALMSWSTVLASE